MGTGPKSAITNQVLNIIQGALDEASPATIEELGLTREAIDLALSDNRIELFSNLVQAGLITDDLISKYMNNTVNDEIENITTENHVIEKNE